jgi:spore maturation protein CgeB
VKVVLFYHSFVSCWSHTSAHFVRGVARQLIRAGHEVHVYEPRDGWSREHALQDARGAQALKEAGRLVPGVQLHLYDLAHLDLDRALDGSSIVIVHDWNEPALVEGIGRKRARNGRFLLLFHDTLEHRPSSSKAINIPAIDGFDVVLSTGEALSQAYRRAGWGDNVYTWHEAADTHVFQPRRAGRSRACDVIWVGDWGKDDRSPAARQYLLDPASQLGLRTDVYGAGLPDDARDLLAQHGARYRGWLPNHRLPQAFARAGTTVHIPNVARGEALPGVPGARLFEALACGIPLVCAPWRDAEKLFPPDCYLAAKSAGDMTKALRIALQDRDAAKAIAQNGLRAIRHKHSCAHRVEDLLKIQRLLSGGELPRVAAASLREVRLAH